MIGGNYDNFFEEFIPADAVNTDWDANPADGEVTFNFDNVVVREPQEWDDYEDSEDEVISYELDMDYYLDVNGFKKLSKKAVQKAINYEKYRN